MFVDIHNHLLPGIDDGAKSEEISLNMLKIAVSEGISSIIATPHYITDYNAYKKEDYDKAYQRICDLIQVHGLDLSLYQGNELFIDSASSKELKASRCLTLAGSRYVLVELPNRLNKAITDELLYGIEYNGFSIVLAHIERYDYFKENPNFITEYIKRGYYTQINTSSITSSDKTMRKYCKKLVKNDFVHFIATDAHNTTRRSPSMQAAYGIVKKWIGSDAEMLFSINGQKVLRNEEIIIKEPKTIKSRFFRRERGE